jgi:zinc transport system permease protein
VDFIAEPLSQAFMRRALLAGAAVAGAGSLLGVFVVQRGLAFLSDGLAHATFGGLALGLLLGATAETAIWVALPFTLAVAMGIGVVRRRSGLGGDVATGVFFAVSFALGVMFLGLRSTRAQPVDVEALLFGSILAVSPDILVAMLVLATVTVAVLALAGSRLAYATFDPELAALSGVPVAALEYLLLALTATIVVLGVKTVGVILVSAFIIIPAATAQLLARSFGRAAAVAVFLGVGGCAVGLLASYHLNVATGATIILVLGALFFAAVASRRSTA